MRVIQEYNGNGAWDSLLEPGISGAAVTVTDAAGATATGTTDADGRVGISTSALAGGRYRVEVANPDPATLQPSVASEKATPADTPSAVRLSSNEEFVDVSGGQDVTVTTGFGVPSDYCQSNPKIVNACQLPIFNSGGSLASNGNVQTLFSAPYRGTGNNVGVETLSTNAQTGTVYGIGYRKQDKRIFAGAFAKRGAPYGPGGPGAIYVVDSDGTTSEWGTVPNAGTTAHSTLLAGNRQDWDFGAVAGKESLGDLDISEDGQDLQVINLNDRQLYVYDATQPTAGSPKQVVDLSANPGCAAADDWRPGALGERQGVLYVGGICSGESTASADDLRAVVMTFDAETYTPIGTVMDQPMNVRRQFNKFNCLPETTSSKGSAWYPWHNGLTCTNKSGWLTNASPFMSDIVVENNGDLVVAFRDRTGDQMGTAAPNFNTETGAYTGNHDYLATGDINRACRAGNGTFVLDFNGACGVAAVAPNQIAGEFYSGDEGGGHLEAAYGGIALSRGERSVAVNLLDPAGAFWTQGYGRVDRETGQGVRAAGGGIAPDAAETLRGVNQNGSGNRINAASGFGKGQGMADMEVLCDMAPVQIGNRLWYDPDGDGTQGADEAPIPGVTVNLYDTDGNLIATTVTNDRGEYYFDSLNDGLEYGTDYSIRLDNPADYEAGKPLFRDDWSLTDPDMGTGPDADRLDSDGRTVDGYPQLEVRTGQAGENDHTFDFGFRPEAAAPAIDIVKFDGRATPPDDPVDGPDPIGGGQESTPGDWSPRVDADTAANAVIYPVDGTPKPVGFVVTNTGTTALGNVSVLDITGTGPDVTGLTCDFSALGGPATGTSWNGPLAPGASFRCEGTLTLAAGETHADTASVTGVPVDGAGVPIPGLDPVGDEDQFHAQVQAIDIVKFDGRATPPANPVDGPDGIGNGYEGPTPGDWSARVDADTSADAVRYADGGAKPVSFIVTNIGTTALGDVEVADLTGSGPDVENVTCDFSALGGPATGTSWSGPFAPGDAFRCEGTLTLAAGESHADTASVTAVPVDGGGEPIPGADPVGDEDQFHAERLAPAIDIVKFDGRATPPADPVDGPDPIGGGQESTPGDWPARVDADTPGSAVIYPVDGAPKPVSFIVTNTGNADLANVDVADVTGSGPDVEDVTCDFSALGGPATGTSWSGPFEPGDSFRCEGTLTLAAGESHADTASVTADPVDPFTGDPVTGSPVGDEDQFHAQVQAIDIVKFDGRATPPANPVDGPDGIGNGYEGPTAGDWPARVDADTAANAVRYADGGAKPVSFIVTNIGTTALGDVQVADLTGSGPDLAGVTCDFSALGGPATGTSWTGPFAPGASFRCEGTLTLAAGESHADTASVTAVPVDGAGEPIPGVEPAGDEDQFHAERLAPAIDIVKFDGRAEPPSDPVDGPDPIGGAQTSTPGDWAARVDADTAANAVRYVDGAAKPVSFIVTNTGNMDLANVNVADLTGSGPDLAGVTCDFSALGGPATGTAWSGPFETGASFRCEGTLTLAAGESHADTASVTADPVDPSSGDPVTGSPVGDEDQFHAERLAASIDIVKFDGRAVPPSDPVDGPDPIGGGQESTPGDWPARVDADTPANAVRYVDGAAKPVSFIVTNTGDVDLANVDVADLTGSGPDLADVTCDFSGLGGPETGTTWSGPFEAGESFRCEGTLTLAAGESHADTASVTADPVDPSSGDPVTGVPVGDEDQFHATRVAPAIDIVKFDGRVTPPANPVDGPDPIGDGQESTPGDWPSTVDADSADAAALYVDGAAKPVTFIVTNTGDTDLADVDVADVTGSGPDVEGVTCDFSALGGPATGTSWSGSFKPGDSFRCEGTLALAAGEAHADTASVTGVPVDSDGTPIPGADPVGDEDRFHAERRDPAIDIVKFDGRATPPANPVDGPDPIGGGQEPTPGDWLARVDADTPANAVEYADPGTRPVSFIVTNTGGTDLGTVTVSDVTGSGPDVKNVTCDFSALGGPATGTSWNGPFKPGDSFRCDGTLTMAAGESHADTASVTAVPLDSSGRPVPGADPLGDEDRFHASVPPAPQAPPAPPVEPKPITSPARVSVTGSLRTKAQKDVRLRLRKDGSVRPTQLHDQITLRSLQHATRGVARLYGPTDSRSSRACTKANLVGSVSFNPRNGTFRTKGITVRAPGYYTWVVTVSGPNGSTLEHGCGLAEETTRVSRPTYGPVRIETGPISPEDEQAQERGAFPSRITHAGVGLNATITTSGVRAGAMEIPHSISRVGWLRNSAQIGDRIGTAIVAGHVSSSWGDAGAFGKLQGLRKGQVVTVRGRDGRSRRYRITRRDTYARSAGIPARHFTTTGKHRLVMVTCTDQEHHSDGTVTYSRNLVVTAEPVK